MPAPPTLMIASAPAAGLPTEPTEPTVPPMVGQCCTVANTMPGMSTSTPNLALPSTLAGMSSRCAAVPVKTFGGLVQRNVCRKVQRSSGCGNLAVGERLQRRSGPASDDAEFGRAGRYIDAPDAGGSHQQQLLRVWGGLLHGGRKQSNAQTATGEASIGSCIDPAMDRINQCMNDLDLVPCQAKFIGGDLCQAGVGPLAHFRDRYLQCESVVACYDDPGIEVLRGYRRLCGGITVHAKPSRADHESTTGGRPDQKLTSTCIFQNKTGICFTVLFCIV